MSSEVQSQIDLAKLFGAVVREVQLRDGIHPVRQIASYAAFTDIGLVANTSDRRSSQERLF